MRRWLLSLCALFITLPTFAQVELTAESWELADIAFFYPSTWDEPFAQQRSGFETLTVAQAFGNNPQARPPAIPFIQFTLIPFDESPPDLAATLREAVSLTGVSVEVELRRTFVGQEGIAVTGSSEDGVFYAEGRAVFLSDNQVLLMVGRGTTIQQASFSTLFNVVANSVVAGTDSEPIASTYGVLWHTERFPGDGETAFLNLQGLSLHDERLYAVDSAVGIVELDSKTGAVLNITPFDSNAQPTDIAVRSEGSYFISDTECACIRIFDNGVWQAPIAGFGDEAPLNIALAPDGTLYATDIGDNGVFIRAITEETENQLIFEDPLFEQPLLDVDSGGNVRLLTQDARILALEGVGFSPILTLDPLFRQATAFTLGNNNTYLVSTVDEGIILYNSDGIEIDRLGRIVPALPLAGEIVNPADVAVALDSTIYWADSDGSFGNVTAMSLQIEGGRVGATTLSSGVPVQGALSELSPQQVWTFEAQQGDMISVLASAIGEFSELDHTLRITGTDANELAFNDDHESDQISNPSDSYIERLSIPADGTYLVTVERVFGDGDYLLGFTKSQAIDLESALLEVNGRISDTIIAEYWTFNGRAGQVITLTMLNVDGDLDTLLRIRDQRGEILIENDDADDPALAQDSQIVQFRLPLNGTYTIEATRFDGTGGYSLLLVVTS